MKFCMGPQRTASFYCSKGRVYPLTQIVRLCHPFSAGILHSLASNVLALIFFSFSFNSATAFTSSTLVGMLFSASNSPVSPNSTFPFPSNPVPSSALLPLSSFAADLFLYRNARNKADSIARDPIHAPAPMPARAPAENPPPSAFGLGDVVEEDDCVVVVVS